MSRLTLQTPGDFDLAVTVTSYGYGRLAPNQWDRERQQLGTVLADQAGDVVRVAITQHGEQLRLVCDRKLQRTKQASIRAAVSRMLRLDEELQAWFKLHRPAKRRRFGRLIRSATLFEDMVKTITSCNVAWPNTVTMNAKLCEHIGGGCFPSPEQLAACDPLALKEKCRVGYRAERIVRLARDVVAGNLNLSTFVDPAHSSDDLLQALQNIHGIGPYAASNILQHLGRYEHVPIDSECYRHYIATRCANRKPPKPGAMLDREIRKTYAAYAPFDFLAYWYELWSGDTVEALRS